MNYNNLTFIITFVVLGIFKRYFPCRLKHCRLQNTGARFPPRTQKWSFPSHVLTFLSATSHCLRLYMAKLSTHSCSVIPYFLNTVFPQYPARYISDHWNENKLHEEANSSKSNTTVVLKSTSRTKRNYDKEYQRIRTLGHQSPDRYSYVM